MQDGQMQEFDDKCLTCVIEVAIDAGDEVPRDLMNHWSMFGCTCDAEAEADALAFIAAVTR